MIEKRQNGAKIARVLVVGKSRFRTNQGGIEQAKRTQSPACGMGCGAWMLEASHVSRVPESGWCLPLPCPARPSVIVVELLENKHHQRDRSLRAPGWQSVEKLWDGGLKVPESRMVAVVKNATLRDLEGRLNSAFLNKSQHFTVHLFRPWIPNSMRCQHFRCLLGAFLAA